MVMVRGPYLSGWASGSIGKTITCRAMFNNKFCMHKFRHSQIIRSAGQIWAQERFARKIALGVHYNKISIYRSGIFGRSAMGVASIGANDRVLYVLPEIPTLIEEV